MSTLCMGTSEIKLLEYSFVKKESGAQIPPKKNLHAVCVRLPRQSVGDEDRFAATPWDQQDPTVLQAALGDAPMPFLD